MEGLTEAEVGFFHENGYVGPFAVCSPEEMAGIRERLLPYLLRYARRGDGSPEGEAPPPKLLFNGHLDNDAIHALASHPAIVERLASLLGPDLLLWRTAFWIKDPGAAAVYWHQDLLPEEGRGSMSNVSAWLAVDEVTEAGGCVQLIKGSHRQTEEDLDLSNEGRRGRYFAESELLPPEGVDAARIVSVPMKAGEFFLFDQLTAHGSDTNRSDVPRIGLALRVIPPESRTRLESPCVLLRGDDRHGHHRLVPGPPSLVRRARGRLGRIVRRIGGA